MWLVIACPLGLKRTVIYINDIYCILKVLVARYCRRFVEQVPLDDFDLHDYNEEESDATENLIDTFSNIDVGFKALL